MFSLSVVAADDTVQAAADVCHCLAEPYQHADTVIAALSEAQSSGDLSTVTEAQDKLMSVINSAQLCMEKLQEKYPHINRDQQLQAEVMKLAEEQCPNPLGNYAQ
ncbi:hypothetical protein C9I98_08620 [Photobacterium sanctipauli]|uniref:Uncharacterized protein n=1 Tax=Photobacterium sanctipauli TaxID=1342794 RepID=A0A2T3NV37_9GAMM|nr:hypothetical protein [Photobacterium sanctipauli]PSW20112.1 hypothetical protein C9I98_08620 [Photobacterium sanctipauli]